MKPSRRRFLRMAVAAAALPAVSRAASAQTYPTRPVRLIVGTPAGGGADLLARLIGQWLSERLYQPFIVENRPGAGTNIATESVVRAAPDGHTLLLFNAASAINATLYEKLSFDFIPVAGVIRNELVMLVNPLVPAKTVPEFIAYAKVAQRTINMASGGNGTPSHVAGELFKIMARVNVVHVPYRGTAPLLTDLLGGQVQVYFGPMLTSIEHIRAGRLRALAVTTAKRSDALPGIPTLGDFLPGYEASTWNGVGAPRNTPVEVVNRLNQEINAGLADAKVKSRLADMGAIPMPMSPVDLGKLIVEETEKWGRVIRAANIRAE